MKDLGLYVLAIFYILAGLNHFRVPDFYRNIMPPYIHYPALMVALSGVAEVALGILVLPAATRWYGAAGVIALLLAVMPVHIYMLQERHGKFSSIPEAMLWLRIPVQCLLIWWASLYLK